MTYEEALNECDRRKAQRKAEKSTQFELPVDELRKASRPGFHLTGSHLDGRIRWVDSYLLEGDPAGPRWQKKLEDAPLFTDTERFDSDWSVETYDAMDF